MKAKVRLYSSEGLKATQHIQLNKQQHHYLYNVMRLKENDVVKVFNGKDGEWLATITSMDRRAGYLSIDELIRPQESLKPLNVAFAPTKNSTVGQVVQQATELGVTKLTPVLTKRSVVNKINLEKLNTIAIEAAEQSHRLSLPIISDIAPLFETIEEYKNNTILFCDEKGDAQSLTQLKGEDWQKEVTILIGPEGGFSDEERDSLRKYTNVVPISMGRRIMRAETALLAAISAYQCLYGDWND